MTRVEEILGQIEYVKGGLPSWIGYHNIYLTNRRVIITSIRNISSIKDVRSLMKGNWRDILNPLKEMVEVEKDLIRPLEEVLSKDKSSLAIRYDEMESLEVFRKDILETEASFIHNNRRYSFSFPTSQLRSARRWKVLSNRTKEMKNCPRCRSELRIGDNVIGYCANCQMSYTINISDLRADFQRERVAISDKKNKITGLLLVGFGTIFFIATYMTFYHLVRSNIPFFEDNTFWFDMELPPLGVFIPCFIAMPLFIIITGLMVYTGTKSGKIMFGVLCILFGCACYFVVIIAYLNNVEGSIGLDLILSGVGTAIISYGVLLIRSGIRKNIHYIESPG